MKRNNPETGKPFVKGDIREDGYIFNQYATRLRKNGTVEEMWLHPDRYFRERVRTTLAHASKRAQDQFLECSVDVDYLLSIFPDDCKCPIFGIPMSFGGDRDTSPSLDRIVPSRGYVVGNLCWISNRANVLKRDVIDPNIFVKLSHYIQHPQLYKKELQNGGISLQSSNESGIKCAA